MKASALKRDGGGTYEVDYGVVGVSWGRARMTTKQIIQSAYKM
jgi:hypothetical protein